MTHLHQDAAWPASDVPVTPEGHGRPHEDDVRPAVRSGMRELEREIARRLNASERLCLILCDFRDWEDVEGGLDEASSDALLARLAKTNRTATTGTMTTARVR